MSLIKTENLEKSRASIEFSIAKEALEAEIVKVYKQQIGKMNIQVNLIM